MGLTITLICYDNILLCKGAAAQGDPMKETNTETKDVLDPQLTLWAEKILNVLRFDF